MGAALAGPDLFTFNTKHMQPFKWLFYIAILAGVAAATACSKEDDYKKYLGDAPLVYPGKVDSLKAYPGKNRVLLTWLLLSDPTIVQAKVFWNNRADTAVFPITRKNGVDTIKAMINNLEERDYFFQVFTYDKNGNESVPAEIKGTVYGAKYEASLLQRVLVAAMVNPSGPATFNGMLIWDKFNENEGIIGTKVEYTNAASQAVSLSFPAGDYNQQLITNLPDYVKGNSLYYTTLYKPTPLALDTFSAAREILTLK
jgi:hypothetical protein